MGVMRAVEALLVEHGPGRGGKITTQGQKRIASEEEARQEENLLDLGLESLQLSSQPLMTAASKVSESGPEEGSAEGRGEAEPQVKDCGDVSSSGRAGHGVKSLEGFRIDDAIYEALLYSRERAYVLRFEKDIESFVQGTEETFLFDTSLSNYQRLLAHRVAQFYGLDTSTVENGVRVMATRTPSTRLPKMKLAEAVQLGEKRADMADAPRLLKKKGAGSKVGSPKEDKDICKGSANKARPLQQRQQDYHKAKSRIFSVDVPERGSASLSGGHSSTSGSPGGSMHGGRLLGQLQGRKSSSFEGAVQVAGAPIGGKKAQLRNRDEEMRDPDFRREQGRFQQQYAPGPGEQQQGGIYQTQRTYSNEFPQLDGPVGASGSMGQGQAPVRIMPISPFQQEPSIPAAATSSSRGMQGLGCHQPQQQQQPPPPSGMNPMHPMQIPMERAGSHGHGSYLPLGGLPQYQGYPQPMQIPPGYVLVPAQPGLPSVPPGMGMYGQHLVPLAMSPHQYAYMASQPRPGQEAGMAVGPPMGASMMPQGHMHMYPGYPTPQGYGMPMHHPVMQRPLRPQHGQQQMMQPYPVQMQARPSAGAPSSSSRRAGNIQSSASLTQTSSGFSTASSSDHPRNTRPGPRPQGPP